MPLVGGPAAWPDEPPGRIFRAWSVGCHRAMAAPRDTADPMERPVQTQFFANRERLPASMHGIQGGGCRSRGTHPPRSHVSIHEMFGGVESRAVHLDELPARLRTTASGDALEGRAVGEQSPEPVLQTEKSLDDKLGQVVRKVSPGGHRGPLKALALWWCRHPSAQAFLVHLVERHLHAHSTPPPHPWLFHNATERPPSAAPESGAAAEAVRRLLHGVVRRGTG